uniref:Uncharacterized protein n=1 Tax=viral metagenome TaxID=1070528 RepID=A0A6C0JIJ8_9ZZZZ
MLGILYETLNAYKNRGGIWNCREIFVLRENRHPSVLCEIVCGFKWLGQHVDF